MAQDFAKKRPAKKSGKRSNNKQAIAKGGTSGNHWSWFFTGLFSGLLFAFSAYIGLVKPDLIQPRVTNIEPIVEASIENEAELELGFYDRLAEAEVQVDVVPVALITEIEEESPVNYLLQAGSFPARQDAENRLAKVILLNMDAAIVPAIVSGKTWHRVRAGPFAGRSKVEDARNVLSSNNIDTIVLLMR